jgi:hypothetical protein
MWSSVMPRARASAPWPPFARRSTRSRPVALLAGEGAELAAQDAVVRVVDVAVEDVAGPVAVLTAVDQIRDGAEAQIARLEQAQGIGLGEALAGDGLS